MPTETTRPATSHKTLVLRLLRKHGPLTRGELGTLCGLSRTTLYDVVGTLMDDGTVVASVPEATARKRGRPAEVLALNPGAGRLLGIEFARRAVRVAAMDATHEIVGTAGEPHGPDVPWRTRVGLARRLADELTHGTPRTGPPDGIGAGVVGQVGPADRPHSGSRDGGAPGRGAPWAPPYDTVATLVHEAFGSPVLLDNNTRLAALAESVRGAAAGERNVLYLRLSHGVGGGLVVAGALHRGAHGGSGEFGHIAVAPDGLPCECGRTGCLETVASVGAVLDACRGAGCAVADMPELLAALEAGDRSARTVLSRAGGHVGRVLADVCLAVGPDVIVVGGELVTAGAALMEPIERELNANVARGSCGCPKLRTAGLGEAGTALGAIALLQQRSLAPSRHPVRQGVYV